MTEPAKVSPAIPGMAMRKWLVRLILPEDMGRILCARPCRRASEQLDVADLLRHLQLAARHQVGVALHLVAAMRLGVVDRLVGALDGRARRITGLQLGKPHADRDAPDLREGVAE